jgi:hypothetical protein
MRKEKTMAESVDVDPELQRIEREYDVILAPMQNGRVKVMTDDGFTMYGELNAGPNQHHEIVLLIRAWRAGYQAGTTAGTRDLRRQFRALLGLRDGS